MNQDRLLILNGHLSSITGMCIKKRKFLKYKQKIVSYIFSEKKGENKNYFKNSEIQHTQYNIEKDYKKVYITGKKNTYYHYYIKFYIKIYFLYFDG